MSRIVMEQIDSEYIKGFMQLNGLSLREESKKLGKDEKYLQVCFSRGRMERTALMFLCANVGLTFEKATCANKKEQKETVSTENAELVISYIQDLGKIMDDVKREIREERSQMAAYLEKICRELSDTAVYLKNEAPIRRKNHEAINNSVQTINNTTQALLGVVRARK